MQAVKLFPDSMCLTRNCHCHCPCHHDCFHHRDCYLQQLLLCDAGRVDDVINVSGHRVGTAEVEGALVSHDVVDEAAVCG